MTFGGTDDRWISEVDDHLAQTCESVPDGLLVQPELVGDSAVVAVMVKERRSAARSYSRVHLNRVPCVATDWQRHPERDQDRARRQLS